MGIDWRCVNVPSNHTLIILHVWVSEDPHPVKLRKGTRSAVN